MSDPIDRLRTALEDRYRIERELGQGGMATVYLAHDLKHERKVAIKVLRPELAAVVGAERFLAEIKTTAALQHPHVLPLHDSGEADGFLFYVMPYVRGESLRERLDREKQLAVDEAVAFARKVADALDYAHEQGVVHRDIKPANILLSERGEPLVADFGIALAVSQAGGGRITETGLSLGTPHYMSPEQATGDRDVDPRSDVYALGCVLSEMLAGQPPFAAPTAQAVLARILTEDPRDVRELRRSVPEHVAAVIARALEKLPADRFQDAASLKAALGDPGYRYRPTSRAAVPASRHGGDGAGTASWARWAAAGVAGIAVFGLGALSMAWLGGESTAPAGVGTVVRMPLDSAVQGDWRRVNFDVSPDGSAIVFASWPAPLQVIELAGPTRRELPGTEGAQSPLFSADGRWIAFDQQDGSLGRVSIDGGAPTAIRNDTWGVPSAWTEDGTLYYMGIDGAYRIREGEDPERILEAGPLAARNVRPLKGGRAVLYTDSPPGEGTGRVMLRDLESGETRELLADGFDAWYAATGHLVYGRSDRSVVAVPFDLERLEVTGLPQVVLDSVITGASNDQMAFRLAGNGTAVYLRGPTPPDRPDNRVAFMSPASPATLELPPLRPDRLDGQGLGVSPDGRRLAYVRNSQPFVFDLVTFRDTPLLPDGGVGIEPLWSPDGERIAYSTLGGEGQLFLTAVKSLEPSDPPKPLPVPGRASMPSGWAPDGDRLLVMALSTGGGEENSDLMIVDVATGEVAPWLESEYSENHGRVAPDGRWASYTSDQTGSSELYVRAFPDPGPAVRVSGPGEGSVRDPAWSPDGDALYYMRGDSVYAVEVDGSGEAFVAGEPEAVLARETDEGTLLRLSVHPDGRFAVILRPAADEAADDAPPPPPPRAYVVINWLREMLDRVEGR